MELPLPPQEYIFAYVDVFVNNHLNCININVLLTPYETFFSLICNT